MLPQLGHGGLVPGAEYLMMRAGPGMTPRLRQGDVQLRLGRRQTAKGRLANNAGIREATSEAPLQPARTALCWRDAYAAAAAHASDLNGEDSGVPAHLGLSKVHAEAGAGSSAHWPRAVGFRSADEMGISPGHLEGESAWRG
jgi:hypothetical protein